MFWLAMNSVYLKLFKILSMALLIESHHMRLIFCSKISRTDIFVKQDSQISNFLLMNILWIYNLLFVLFNKPFIIWLLFVLEPIILLYIWDLESSRFWWKSGSSKSLYKIPSSNLWSSDSLHQKHFDWIPIFSWWKIS